MEYRTYRVGGMIGDPQSGPAVLRGSRGHALLAAGASAMAAVTAVTALTAVTAVIAVAAVTAFLPAVAHADTADASVARPSDRAAAIAAARAATDRRDWNDALARWRALESAAPGDVDLLIESARVHGFADRNADAADRYLKVIGIAPARRGDVLLATAWQLLWAGHAAQAEALFVEIAAAPAKFAGGNDGFDAWLGAAEARESAGDLAGAGEALGRARALRPGDRIAARRAARVHAEMGRQDEAIATLSAIAGADPRDREVRYELARVRNAAGRHREAVADYRAAIDADRALGHAPSEDALFDRARALRWAGYDDLAHGALEGLAQADARWLRDWRTARETRRFAAVGIDTATDRDRLDAIAVFASFGWRPTPASEVEIATRRVDLSEPTREVHGERLSASWRTRLGADAATIGAASDRGPVWPSLTLTANRYGDWRPLTGAARLRWDPSDVVRLDGELGRELIETPLAIANRVSVDVAAFGADWRWRTGSSLAGSLAALKFDEGNLRTRVNLRAVQLLHARPRVAAGIEAMAFRSTDPTSDTNPARGYWNPRDYREARAFVTFAHDAGRWDFAMKFGLGAARETDGFGNRSSGSPNLLELAAGYDLTKSLRLRARAGGAGGAMGVGSGGQGYWRRYAGVDLTGWF